MNKWYIDEFDTRLAGSPVAKLLLTDESAAHLDKTAYDAFLAAHQAKNVFCRAAFVPENILFLEGEGYHFVSTRILYRLDELRSPVTSIDSSLRFCTQDEYHFSLANKGVAELIEVIGRVSHYAKDHALAPDLYSKVYASWFTNSFNGYAQKIYMVLDGEMLVGLVSLKASQGKWFLDLVGVNGAYQGRGIAGFLLTEAYNFVRDFSPTLYLYTQGENVKANRFYQKAGFVVEDMELVYHKQY